MTKDEEAMKDRHVTIALGDDVYAVGIPNVTTGGVSLGPIGEFGPVNSIVIRLNEHARWEYLGGPAYHSPDEFGYEFGIQWGDKPDVVITATQQQAFAMARNHKDLRSVRRKLGANVWKFYSEGF